MEDTVNSEEDLNLKTVNPDPDWEKLVVSEKSLSQ